MHPILSQHQATSDRHALRRDLEDAIRRGEPPAGLVTFTVERFLVPSNDPRVRLGDAMWLAVDAYLDTLPPPPAGPARPAPPAGVEPRRRSGPGRAWDALRRRLG